MRQHEEDDSVQAQATQNNGNELEGENETMEDDVESEAEPSTETLRRSDGQATTGAQQPQSTSDAGSGPPAAPPLPTHLVGSSKFIQTPFRKSTVRKLNDVVRDEGMKNLLISWYYAGYYTGLYEGQQQAAKKATEEKLEHVSSCK